MAYHEIKTETDNTIFQKFDNKKDEKIAKEMTFKAKQPKNDVKIKLPAGKPPLNRPKQMVNKKEENKVSDVEDEFDVSSGFDKEDDESNNKKDQNESYGDEEYDIEEYDEEVEIEVDEDFDEN